jgi:hypothetical protein
MREPLVAYLYGEATPEESRLLEAHLSACAVCEQEMAAFERVRGMLQQWRLDDLPVLRVEAGPAPRNRSALDAFKEFVAILPVWAKVIGAAAAAMIVLAALGTEVSIDSNGFRMRADIFRPGAGETVKRVPADSNEPGIEQLRAELKAMVNTLIADSERQQKEQLKAQLASFESQLQTMRSAELAKLAETVQQQRARLRMIERDLDRREGYDLTDILFSELTESTGRGASGKPGSSD